MVHNGEWKWPWDWIDKFPELSQVFIPMFTDNRDKVLWKRNNGNYTDFSTKKAWEDMRSNGSELYWNKLVWFSQSILGHMFVVWMAVLGINVVYDDAEGQISWLPALVECQPDDACPIVPILCSSEDAAAVGIALDNRVPMEQEFLLSFDEAFYKSLWLMCKRYM
ncbi:hypothetical protein Tco_1257435 [Tanacetum coccineum]